MRLRIAIMTAAFLGYGGLALAGARAELEAPVNQPLEIIAGSAIWHCAGTSCTAVDATFQAADTLACRKIAKAAGRVVSFEVSHWRMPDPDLAKCNSSAKPAASTPADH